jgi:hypothetical protein
MCLLQFVPKENKIPIPDLSVLFNLPVLANFMPNFNQMYELDRSIPSALR